MIVKLEHSTESGSHEVKTSDIPRFPAATDTFVLKRIAEQSMICHLRSCLPHEGAGLISVAMTDQGILGANAMPAATRIHRECDIQWIPMVFRPRRGTWSFADHTWPRSYIHTPHFANSIEVRSCRGDVFGVVHLIVGFIPTVAIRAWRLILDDWGTTLDAVELTLGIASEIPARSEGPPSCRHTGEMAWYDRTER